MKNSVRIKKTMKAAFGIVFATTLFFAGFSTELRAQDSDEVHSVVDEMPEIKGGLSELYEEIEYPSEAVKNDISGRVYLKVIVHEDGTATDPKVIKDIGGGCGDAAAEAITKVEFEPGKQNGEKVKVEYSLPVTFRIDKR